MNKIKKKEIKKKKKHFLACVSHLCTFSSL